MCHDSKFIWKKETFEKYQSMEKLKRSMKYWRLFNVGKMNKSQTTQIWFLLHMLTIHGPGWMYTWYIKINKIKTHI